MRTGSHAFDLYKQTPEYREINGPAGMTLGQFKFIFFWEWFHRLIGRLIGVAFALPLIWFAVRRSIPQGYGWKLVGLFVLGGMQGVLGWYMVMTRPRRSHRRQPLPPVGALAAGFCDHERPHLGSARSSPACKDW